MVVQDLTPLVVLHGTQVPRDHLLLEGLRGKANTVLRLMTLEVSLRVPYRRHHDELSKWLSSLCYRNTLHERLGDRDYARRRSMCKIMISYRFSCLVSHWHWLQSMNAMVEGMVEGSLTRPLLLLTPALFNDGKY